MAKIGGQRWKPEWSLWSKTAGVVIRGRKELRECADYGWESDLVCGPQLPGLKTTDC